MGSAVTSGGRGAGSVAAGELDGTSTAAAAGSLTGFGFEGAGGFVAGAAGADGGRAGAGEVRLAFALRSSSSSLVSWASTSA